MVLSPRSVLPVLLVGTAAAMCEIQTQMNVYCTAKFCTPATALEDSFSINIHCIPRFIKVNADQSIFYQYSPPAAMTD